MIECTFKKKKYIYIYILLANNREYPYTHLLYTKSCSHIVVQDNSSEFMLEEQVRWPCKLQGIPFDGCSCVQNYGTDHPTSITWLIVPNHIVWQIWTNKASNFWSKLPSIYNSTYTKLSSQTKTKTKTKIKNQTWTNQAFFIYRKREHPKNFQVPS